MRHKKGIRILVLAAVLLIAGALGAVESLQIRTTPDGHQFSYGRGVCVGKDLVVTCFHVVDPITEKCEVLIGDKWVTVKVSTTDETTDLALLELPAGSGLKVVPVADVPEVDVNGNPGDAPPVERSSKVEVVLINGPDLDIEATDQAPGFSGSPVTMDGRLIGIIHAFLQRSKRVVEPVKDQPGAFTVRSEPLGPPLAWVTAPNAINKILNARDAKVQAP